MKKWKSIANLHVSFSSLQISLQMGKIKILHFIIVTIALVGHNKRHTLLGRRDHCPLDVKLDIKNVNKY